MTFKITKEDYKLLNRIIKEGFNEIILKKAYNVKIPKEYSIDNYINLMYKISKQSEQQKVLEQEEIFDITSLDELALKIENEKITREKILETSIKELAENEIIVNCFFDYIEKILGSNIE